MYAPEYQHFGYKIQPRFFFLLYEEKRVDSIKNKTEIAALSASRRREKLTWQTKITLDDNSACSIQDYRN